MPYTSKTLIEGRAFSIVRCDGTDTPWRDYAVFVNDRHVGSYETLTVAVAHLVHAGAQANRRALSTEERIARNTHWLRRAMEAERTGVTYETREAVEQREAAVCS